MEKGTSVMIHLETPISTMEAGRSSRVRIHKDRGGRRTCWLLPDHSPSLGSVGFLGRRTLVTARKAGFLIKLGGGISRIDRHPY